MRVFISSVIKGLEGHREAAARAARALGHEVRRAEDFGASPDTPQQTCLAGVRWAEVVLLLLGSRYGTLQASGLSATHEEYREARGQRDVLAFILAGETPESQQGSLVEEIQTWETGIYTERVDTPDQLRDQVTRALRDLELARAVGPVDEAEMLERARALLPEERGLLTPSLTLVVVGGPRREVLRPAEIEVPELERDIKREALLGDHAVLDPAYGTRAQLQGDALSLVQERSSLLVDQLGSVR